MKVWNKSVWAILLAGLLSPLAEAQDYPAGSEGFRPALAPFMQQDEFSVAVGETQLAWGTKELRFSLSIRPDRAGAFLGAFSDQRQIRANSCQVVSQGFKGNILFSSDGGTGIISDKAIPWQVIAEQLLDGGGIGICGVGTVKIPEGRSDFWHAAGEFIKTIAKNDISADRIQRERIIEQNRINAIKKEAFDAGREKHGGKFRSLKLIERFAAEAAEEVDPADRDLFTDSYILGARLPTKDQYRRAYELSRKFPADATLQSVISAARRQKKSTRRLGTDFREFDRMRSVGWIELLGEEHPRREVMPLGLTSVRPAWGVSTWVLDYGFHNLPDGEADTNAVVLPVRDSSEF